MRSKKYAGPNFIINNKISKAKLIEHFLKETPAVTYNYNTYVYNNANGVYEYKDDVELKKYFYNIAKDFDYSSLTCFNIGEFVKLLKIETTTTVKSCIEKKYINCKNGIYEIATNKLLNHTPDHKIINQFNGSYINNSEFQEIFENSNFYKFIKSLFRSDITMVNLIQEIIGLCLSPHSREVEKAFIFLGDGRNGKSSLMDIIEALFIDKSIIGSVSISGFSDRFAPSMLDGKYVNIVRDDESRKINEPKNYKAIISGEPISLEKKNKDLYRTSINITMISAMNTLPSNTDVSDGFFRRHIIIPFKESFGTKSELDAKIVTQIKNHNIVNDIINNELDIVITWGVLGLIRLSNNNWELSVPESCEKELMRYKESSNSFVEFLNSTLEITKSESDILLTSAIHSSYADFCKIYGYNRLNNRSIKSILINQGAINANVAQNKSAYKRIRFKS